MALHPGTPVLALGDFNNILDPQLDRLSTRPGNKRATPRTSPFATLISELGLRDVWRGRNRDVQCYSCHSASHGGLSRIDMGLGNDMLLPHVLDTACEPRLLSDHSPFWVRVDSTAAPSVRPMWRVNPFWLTLLPTPDPIPGELKEFLIFNKQSASGVVVWNAIKAFLSLLIWEISGIKKRSREWEDTVRLDLQRREMALVADPTPANQNSWTEAQSLYIRVVLSKTEKEIFPSAKLFWGRWEYRSY